VKDSCVSQFAEREQGFASWACLSCLGAAEFPAAIWSRDQVSHSGKCTHYQWTGRSALVSP
jgi:hypothetical protein